MLVLPHFIAYEVTPGWGRATISFAGPLREVGACYLWERCHEKHGASFRAMTADGIECGTPRPGAQHGVAGVLTERCHECGQMFTTHKVAEPLCPGCELLSIGSSSLARSE